MHRPRKRPEELRGDLRTFGHHSRTQQMGDRIDDYQGKPGIGTVITMALGESTNAAIHITAMARRTGIDADLDRFDRISHRVPTFANIRPSGACVVVFDDDDMAKRIDDDLEVDENSVLVLRSSGPLGGPGMPEWGIMLPVPQKLLDRGVRGMVRSGDEIDMDVLGRALTLHASDDALTERRGLAVRPARDAGPPRLRLRRARGRTGNARTSDPRNAASRPGDRHRDALRPERTALL